MRIALNARVLATEKLRGWSRYTVNLLDGLLRSGHEIFLFADQPINQKLIPATDQFCQVTLRAGRSYVDWEQRVLAQLCYEHRIDVLHCPTNYGLPFFSKVKKVLTLHDAIEKVFYDPLKKRREFLRPEHWKVRSLHYLSQKAADKIITVSEHAKQDIVKHYGVPEEKITVIYEAADKDFHPQNVQPVEVLQEHFPELKVPYFFYVGGLEQRKNIDFLLNGWQAANLGGFQLVVGGGTAQEIEYFKNRARDKNVNVLFTGYISAELLPTFYGRAYCFVYPSLYEGFGLQVVEAMQMGTPVICSNVTSLPEILGDPSCTFDPRNVESLKNLFIKMTGEAFWKEKASAIQFRREAFSWDKTVKKTLEIYESLADI